MGHLFAKFQKFSQEVVRQARPWRLALILFLLILVVVFEWLNRSKPAKPPVQPFTVQLPKPPPSKIQGRLAIIIDDIGYHPQNAHRLFALSQAITLAVIPSAPHARELAIAGHRAGHEIMLHIPMEPLHYDKAEAERLKTDMSAEAIDRFIAQAMNQVPHAKGLNNHMGSLFTGDATAVGHLMATAKKYNLYVVDSKTIGQSKIPVMAEKTGARFLVRDVFLDNERSVEKIHEQLRQAEQVALTRGQAIAIGHPYDETLIALIRFLSNKSKYLLLTTPSQLLQN